MSKKLRYFVKLDKEGTPISTTNIARTKSPKIGVWQEIFKNTCCGDEISYDVDFGTPLSGINITLDCNGTDVLTFVIPSAPSGNYDELLAHLQEYASFLGSWYLGDGVIILKVSSSMQKILCSGNTLSLTIADADSIF